MDGIVTQAGMFARGGSSSSLLDGLVDWWEDADVIGKHAGTVGTKTATLPVVAGPNTNAWAGANGFQYASSYLGIESSAGFTVALIAKINSNTSRPLRNSGNLQYEATGFCRVFRIFGVSSSFFLCGAGSEDWALVVIRGNGSSTYLNRNLSSQAVLASTYSGLLGTIEWGSLNSYAQTLAGWNREITVDEETELYNGGSFLTYADL